MKDINIYLNFAGNCEAAFTFYKSVFGGEFTYIGRFKEMPKQEGMPDLPKDMEEMIMHVGLPIGKHAVLMGSDTGGEWAPTFVQGNNFAISLSVDTKEEADHYFKALSANGKVIMPMEDAFWGDYFGQFVDQFGISWMIMTESKK